MKFLSIPENVNPDWFPNIYSMRYCYLIHKVLQEQYFNKKKPNEFVSLNKEILKFFLGTNYKTIITELDKQEIIDVDGAYFAGVKSKGYKLTERFQNVKHKRIEITDKKLKGRLRTFQNTAEAMKQFDDIEQLQKPLNDLSIDTVKAFQFVNDTYSNDMHRYNSRMNSIYNVNETPIIPFRNDNKSKRLYNSIGIMPKDIRPFCNVSGESLISVDISASQLYHFIALTKRFLETCSYEYGDFDIFGNEVNAYSFDSGLNDIRKFQDLTCTNRIYEFFMERMNFTGSKRQFKDQFFGQVWYCDIPKYYINEMQMVLDAEFPTISKALRHYKHNSEGFYTHKQDKYKNLPILLQSMERENVVDRVAKNLLTAYPNMFVATVHDCVITTQGNESKVLNEMQRVFTNQYGNIPAMKAELLTC